ncbi:DUF3106 domain-containing protein [Deefgea sp. CFH1-16]|nr:DUF3106 domain-containing protein [Deefgea sp. CFH1-16]
MRARINRWATLSPEQRERARENYRRLQAMSPEERQKLMQQRHHRRASQACCNSPKTE